jgi:hypothetical protein
MNKFNKEWKMITYLMSLINLHLKKWMRVWFLINKISLHNKQH